MLLSAFREAQVCCPLSSALHLRLGFKERSRDVLSVHHDASRVRLVRPYLGSTPGDPLPEPQKQLQCQAYLLLYSTL